MPNSKIVATLGPASNTPVLLRKLSEVGVDVFRLNASHGSRNDHQSAIEAVRSASRESGRPIGILLDLQGPKIRLGRFTDGKCTLQTGARFTITTAPILGNRDRASTGYAGFTRDVKAGDRVLLVDGTVELRALAVDGDAVHFEVTTGGPIGDNKGINLPGIVVSAPSLTPKDLDDLRFGLEVGVDMIALSFVRSAKDVEELRTHIGERCLPVPIIAKIEKPQAWDNIDSILDAADGVMVARGDLGVEMALERVPPIQKSIIRRARRKSKFVITATQMLESMIEHATPTRAEVSDVANAIYDGTDAVMLSAETATGAYPLAAVSYMVKIAAEAERSIRARGFQESKQLPTATPEILADSAYRAARAANAAAIVVFTNTGNSARLIARYRSPVPILAVTPNESVSRNLTVCYGVNPVLAPEVDSTDEMLAQMDRILLERHLLKRGDMVVFIAGQPVGRKGSTNMMKLHRLGEINEFDA